MQYRAEDLIQIFKQLFRTQYNTELVSGSTEPLYRVKRRTDLYHQIIFAHGFFSSALHEIAHWCVAGPERRQQDDYGYWYAPDGRNQVQQTEFFQAERKPQALEWIFSTAAGYRFQFSADNLGAEIDGLPDFKLAVQQQVHDYLVDGLPLRANRFVLALCKKYGNHFPRAEQFPLGEELLHG